MELIYLLTTISSGLILIIAYFLKSVFSDVKKLKALELEVALMKQSLNVVEDNIKKHHGKLGAQDMRSNKFDTSFALITKDIKQILARLPKIEG